MQVVMREHMNDAFLSQGINHLWGIVLAGGNGMRLQPFIKELYGVALPKQYCALTGTRSMLRHTIDRARMLIPRQQLVTVVNKSHLQYAEEQLSDQPADTVVVQPMCRETGPGILLPLVHI